MSYFHCEESIGVTHVNLKRNKKRYENAIRRRVVPPTPPTYTLQSMLCMCIDMLIFDEKLLVYFYSYA